MNKNKNVVGIIPAAGFARRISSIVSCSKEIYPIQFPNGDIRVASSLLMQSYANAGVDKTYIVLRTGKWDIPEHFEDGDNTGLNLAYIVSNQTGGVPYTIDKAYPFINENIVLLGFPDILFTPLNAYEVLLDKQRSSGADLVLGLFKTDKPEKADMVSFNHKGNPIDIVIKPNKTVLEYTWIMAVWTPLFSQFIHFYLQDERSFSTPQKELYIGNIVKEAIYGGLNTAYIKFDKGAFIDIGTPAELKKVRDRDWINRFYSGIYT